MTSLYDNLKKFLLLLPTQKLFFVRNFSPRKSRKPFWLMSRGTHPKTKPEQGWRRTEHPESLAPGYGWGDRSPAGDGRGCLLHMRILEFHTFLGVSVSFCDPLVYDQTFVFLRGRLLASGCDTHHCLCSSSKESCSPRNARPWCDSSPKCTVHASGHFFSKIRPRAVRLSKVPGSLLWVKVVPF